MAVNNRLVNTDVLLAEKEKGGSRNTISHKIKNKIKNRIRRKAI